MRLKNLLHQDIWIAAVLLALFTLPFAFTDLDLTLAGLFYRDGWPLGGLQPWAALYRWGTFPGLILAAIALFLLAGSWIWPKLQTRRRAAALIVLTMVIGPGLLVNALGKDYWGRPRPRDLIKFSGSQEFHRVIEPGVPGRGKSFPCGHASVGYLLAVLYFLTRRKSLKGLYLISGLGYGTLMGVGRMVQGAHFASDVIWSGGLVYLTAALLHHVILPPQPDLRLPGEAEAAPDPRKKLMGVLLLIMGLGLLAAFFLMAAPYFKVWSGSYDVPKNLTAVHLTLPFGKEEIQIFHGDQSAAISARAELRGFGFPKLELVGKFQGEVQGTTLNARLHLDFNRLVTERMGRIVYVIRNDLALSVTSAKSDADIYIGERSESGQFGALRVNSRRGDIHFWARPGSIVYGPVELITRRGNVKVRVDDLWDPGKPEWEIGTDKGTLLVEIRQSLATRQKWRFRGWSRWGDVAYRGTISPACGMDLRWDEGDGRSGLTATGAWRQEGSRVYGPDGMGSPHLELFLATSQGLLGMELKQGEGQAVAPLLPTPTPLFTPWKDTHSAMEEIKLAPTPAAETPEWIERELISLPTTKP